MTIIRAIHQTLIITITIVAAALPAQQPTQFKAAVKMKDGSDGSTASGTMYFGGAKMRAELTKGGQNIVVLADPTAKSQYVLMPSQNVYMQMPIGQGPVSIPITGPSDPTNPCSSGSGNTDCARGPNETVNGYDAVRWDYTSAEGVRTRAWVSTRLRFPVKSEDDNGSSMEFSNITEGPQAASLFSIPSGYQKMDVGAMGGGRMARGERGARSSASDPVASAMANMSPQAAAALAAARRGDVPRGTMGPTGSAWEKGKGWVINLTVTATSSSGGRGEGGTNTETRTAKIVGAITLNLGTPAAGVPNTPGPMWQFMASDAVGTPEANATPISYSMDVSGRIDRAYAGACGISEDPYTSVGLVKASVQKRVPVSKVAADPLIQGLFKISADLKTYDLLAEINDSHINEVTQTKLDGKSCRDGKPYTKNTTDTVTTEYPVRIDLKDLPLPSAVGPVTGSKRMPMTLGRRQMDATVNWTIAPIR